MSVLPFFVWAINEDVGKMLKEPVLKKEQTLLFLKYLKLYSKQISQQWQ